MNHSALHEAYRAHRAPKAAKLVAAIGALLALGLVAGYVMPESLRIALLRFSHPREKTNMIGVLRRRYPREFVEPFVDEVQKDPQLWQLILDRELERKRLEILANKLGKRYDLEPEAFPPLQRPTNVEAIAQFLERNFSRKDRMLASQIAGIASERARRELGLQS